MINVNWIADPLNLQVNRYAVSPERENIQSLEMINGRVHACHCTVSQEAYISTCLQKERNFFFMISYHNIYRYLDILILNVLLFFLIYLGLPVIEETPDFFYPFFLRLDPF
jgi:hypothetical protein